MSRWFYHNNIENSVVTLTGQEQRHVFSVNRLRPGDTLVLTDGQGTIAEGRINIDESINILSVSHKNPPLYKIHLFIAPPRKNQMDQILSQSAELGVWSVNPVITERAVVIPDKDSTPEKWRSRLIESCKQAHNPFLPEIHKPKLFREAVDYSSNCSFTGLFGSTSEENRKISEIKFNYDIAWFVGPEGGFSDNEMSLMVTSGLHPFKIGSHILRVETACIAGLAVITKLTVDG